MTSNDLVPDPSKILFNQLKSKRDYALALAEAGFRIHPLQANAKGPPLLKDWPNQATFDPTITRQRWTDASGESANHNLGLAPDPGFLVVDFDRRSGGVNSYTKLTVIDDKLPATFTVQTRDGGYHVYLSCDEPIPSGANVLAHINLPGVDLKSHGGYVLAPGSEIDGNHYQVVNAAPIARAPRWLLDALGSRRRKEPSSQQPVHELDTPEGVSMAVEWLKHDAPEAIEGAGGDDATYRTAARLRDFAISESLALELMLDHWNETMAIPPWAPDELERKVRHAYAYGTATPGIEIARQAANEFPALSEDEVERIEASKPSVVPTPAGKTDRPRFRIERRSEVDEPNVPWLVKDALPQNGFGVIYGKPGSYKSFVALHLADMLATGRPFLGQQTTTPADRPDIIYLAAEGGAGLKKRLDAAAQVHGTAPDNIGFVRHALNLQSTRDDCDSLIRAIRAENWRPCLIVVDTLAQTFGPGNENASEDMNAFVFNMGYLRQHTGATILVIHHSGKDQAKGMRGSSALLGAVDAELEVAQTRPAPKEGAGIGLGEFHARKIRDGSGHWSVGFTAEKIVWDMGERSSLAVRECREGEAATRAEEVRLSPGAFKALEKLRELCAASPDGSVSVSNWRRSVGAAIGLGGDQWRRARGELKACAAYVSFGKDSVKVGELFQEKESDDETS